jgi:hypothetical protein
MTYRDVRSSGPAVDPRSECSPEESAAIAEAYARGWAEVAKIIDLCGAAGRCDLIAGFVRARKTAVEVQRELQKDDPLSFGPDTWQG